jgi:hypothetical protein
MPRGLGPIAVLVVAVLGLAGSAQAASISPTTQDFGSQNVGTTGAPTTFTLTTSANYCNNYDFGTFMCLISTSYSTDTTALGGGPGVIATSGDFTTHNISCNYPAAYPPPSPGPAFGAPNICQFEASFAPTVGGARSRTLTFSDTGGPTAILTLTGTGVSPPTPTPSATLPTGQREAALKRCKKKFPKGSSKRRKCLRHARQLPV